MTDPSWAAPAHHLWSLAEADAYLPALDRLLASIHPSADDAPGEGMVDRSVVVDGVLAVLAEDGVIVRDLAQRLVDFRARAADGSVVLLCRVGDEDHIAWWHGLHDGFAGRRSLAQDPPW